MGSAGFRRCGLPAEVSRSNRKVYPADVNSHRRTPLADMALEAAGLSTRIDHRARRSLDRKPELRLPLNIYKMERESGRPSRVGEALRQQHRERVAAWVIGPGELARVMQRQKEAARRALVKQDALERSVEKRLSRAVFYVNAIENTST